MCEPALVLQLSKHASPAEEGGNFIPPHVDPEGSIWQAAKMAKQTPLRAPFAHRHRQKLHSQPQCKKNSYLQPSDLVLFPR